MNKKGFTLIELLAVIIILSLLALLTSTAVVKLVKDAKSDLSSAQIELIKSAAETWGADNLSKLPLDGRCSYLTVKDLKDYGLLDSNLKDPNDNEKISDDLKIRIDTKLNETSGQLITSYEVNPKSVAGCMYGMGYKNGDVVYFNVSTGKSCTDYSEAQSATGINSGCMKFYVFNDFGGNTLNLLLDHNTTSQIDWYSGLDEPETLFYQLKIDTANWIGTQTPKNYEYYPDEYYEVPRYIIYYNEYKARLITTFEITQILGDKSWTPGGTNYLYFANSSIFSSESCTYGNTSGCKYRWLYDRTGSYCTDTGCLNNEINGLEYIGGYWTADDAQSIKDSAWCVKSEGVIGSEKKNYFSSGSLSNIGIRPVIEVSRDTFIK